MQSVAMANAMKNDEWITNGEAPDPEVLPKVPGFPSHDPNVIFS